MSSTRIPIIRTSERRSFKRCQQQWYWAWRCGLKPLGEISDALWFGTLVHAALAAWYEGPGLKRGPHPAETFAKLAADEIRFIRTEARERADNLTTFIEEKLEPAQALGIDLLTGYVECYGNDDAWHVIQPEHSGQVDLRNPTTKELLAIYAFTYDLVYRDLYDDTIWLGEHKTAKSIRTDHLPLDDQAGSYFAVAPIELRASGLIGPKERLIGINYNFLRKATADDRPRNPDGHYCNKPTKADYAKAFTEWSANASHVTWAEAYQLNVPKMTLANMEDFALQNNIEVYGEVSKLQPKPRFVREQVFRSPDERQTQINRIIAEAQQMTAIRSGELPIVKNPTMDCAWCPYRDMCLLDERGNAEAVKDYRRSVFTMQDPYADHRKSAGED